MLVGGMDESESTQQEEVQRRVVNSEERVRRMSSGNHVREQSQRIRQPPVYLRDYVTY